MADTRPLQKAIESVSFSTASQSFYERSDASAVHILHYKSAGLDVFADQDGEYPAFQFQDHAEIILCYATDSDLVRMILHLTPTTQFHLGKDQKALIIANIKCIGYTTANDAAPPMDVEATIRFSTIESCASFKQKLEDMRMELFILTLQYPAVTETKLVKVQASTIYTEHLQVADVEVSILQDSTNNQLRLTVVSRDGLTIISQDLPATFLSSFHTNTPDFKSPSYVIQLDESGIRRIKKYAQGFSVLGFSDVAGKSGSLRAFWAM
ncbi:hypothetical protein BJY04DRAFT_40427 [Aspergillus karnatakaensis]|uniref:uncharacterized protein n=1 Tax=Aspergillus karnatakaensis TaxID=1810916 RepID=UPI003CCD1069